MTLDYRIDLWNAAPGVSSPPHLGSGSVQVPTSISGAGIHGHGARAQSEPRRDESDSPPAKAKPILVLVDDEPDVLQSVHDLLRMEYEVHTFEHGPDALEFLRKNPVVHVILSDQRMPGMSGVEVLRLAMAIRPETTRLLFTAYSDLRPWSTPSTRATCTGISPSRASPSSCSPSCARPSSTTT